MKIAVIADRVLISVAGLALLVLGICFWTGHALALIPVHMAVGGLLVLCIWAMVGLAIRARVTAMPLLVSAVALSVIMPVFGMYQMALLPGDYHWLVRVLHLLIGFGAVALGHALGKRILRQRGGPA